MTATTGERRPLTLHGFEVSLMLAGILGYFLKGGFDVEIGFHIGLAAGSLLFFMHIVRPIPKLIASYLLVVSFGTVLLLLNNGVASGLAYLPIIVSSFGIAAAVAGTMHSNARMHYLLSLWLFWGVVGYVVIYFGLTGSVKGALAGSRNHVSVAVLFLCAYYCVVARLHGKKISIVYPAAVFLVSLLSVGTAGIIASGVFLFGVLVSRGTRQVLTIIGVLALVSALMDVSVLLDRIDKELLPKLSVERLLGGDVRFKIISQYVDNLNSYKFVLGVPLEELVWTVDIGTSDPLVTTNPHNAYLLLHAKIGILAFVVILGLGIVTWRLMVIDRTMFFLFVAILLRAFSDTVAISHGYYEWCVLLVVLYSLGQPYLPVSDGGRWRLLAVTSGERVKTLSPDTRPG